MYIRVCMYVCMHGKCLQEAVVVSDLDTYIYVCVRVCTRGYVCLHACKVLSIYQVTIRMYVCMYACMCITTITEHHMRVCVHVCMYVCLHYYLV